MHVIERRGPRPRGPLVPYVDAFRRRSVALGYAPTTVRSQAPLISGFSKWLGQEKIPLKNISSDHTARYLRYRARHRCPRRDDVATLRRLLDLLREEEIIPEQPACPESTPAQRLLDEYACYLRQERALSPRTLIYYLDFARGFLGRTFGEGKLEMSALRAADVIKFVQRQVAHRSRGSARKLTTGLRSFPVLRAIAATSRLTLLPEFPRWRIGRCPRSRGRSSRKTSAGSWHTAIAALL